MKAIIEKVSEREDLSRHEASSAMRMIMEGEATDVQIAALLMGLKIKGEQPEELLGFAEVMREKSLKAHIDDPDAVDLCGTGGDGAGTFNISTVASFVVAGAGATVAKHGNRSISSSSGSADVLRALGVNVELTPDKVSRCINTIGIGFLFAPLFHPAMKHAAKTRSEMGVKTCFNLLGPLTNPAGVRRQLAGAFSRRAAAMMAEVFLHLGAVKVYVISSHDGLDEISLNAPTAVCEVDAGEGTKRYDIAPDSFGLHGVGTPALRGGTAEVNAAIARRILSGEKIPHRDSVVANSAIGLMAAGKAASIGEGVALAIESIDSGRAMNKLNALREASA